MKKSARLIAFETLYKIFQKDSYSNLAVDAALSGLTEDKAFITALVYGVIERKLTLDYFLHQHVHGKVKPKVQIILRMGVYQLLFMEKVPAAAAIHESVELAKEIKQEYYCPLINAVLHKVDKNRAMPDDLSVRYSVPEHLLSMWKKAYGAETVEQFLPYVNGRAPLFAVPNHLYVNADTLLYELHCEGLAGEIIDDVVRITDSLHFDTCKAFNRGLFHVQDLSCYRCCKALDVQEGNVVLDVCAAPGGKSFTLASLMKNNGKILAFDLHAHRVQLIAQGAARMNFSCIESSVRDAAVFTPDLPPADRILCDVPCSGFGIIRRKPEIRYKELDTIKELPAMQLQILTVSARYLKQGGRMVYSTCTLNKRENEKVVQAFLENSTNYRMLEEKTFFPSEVGTDGFYYAVLERIS